MPRTPIPWRKMEAKVAEIEARALAILTASRVPKPVREAAVAIATLAAEILRGDGT